MAAPRLKGNAVALVRALAGFGPFTGLIWKQMSRDYHLREMLALPASARDAIEVEPRPLAGAPPRAWHDAGLGPPATARCTAAALRRAYRSGETDPVAVLEAIAQRLEAGTFGLSTHSPFVALDLERAREAAVASRERWRRGTPLGPLDGIPVPVKDEHDMVGLPTRGGTAYLTEPATQDSFCVRRLRSGGALLYGKTHTTEWGMSPLGFNPHYSMPRNAWSSEHAPGGSSTGSALAVALGYASVAVSSDGGGSIRVPAASNGLFGIKPTYIRVGRTGDIFAHSSVSHIGPIGGSCEDLVDWLAVAAAEADPDDPVSTYAPDRPGAADAWRSALGRGVRGCRVGIDEAEWADADPSVAGPAREALAALEREGARLVEVRVPNARHATATGVLVIAGETMGGLTEDIAAHGHEMGDDMLLNMRVLGQARASEVYLANRTRRRLRLDLAKVMASVDVLALPATTLGPTRWPLADDRVAITDVGAMLSVLRYVFLGNLTGLPAGVAPVGRHDGLPVGLMLMADAWDEASALAVMAHLERLDVAGLGLPPGYASLRPGSG